MAETVTERIERIKSLDQKAASKEALAVSNEAMDSLEARQPAKEWADEDTTRCSVNLSLSEWAIVVGSVWAQAAEEGLAGEGRQALFDAMVAKQVTEAMLAAYTVAAIPAETALSA